MVMTCGRSWIMVGYGQPELQYELMAFCWKHMVGVCDRLTVDYVSVRHCNMLQVAHDGIL